MTATVVIVSKNQRCYLERSLPTIAAQRGVSGKVEVIVVDDGSTDGARDTVRNHGAQLVDYGPDPFNYARAFNRGAAVARGQYLVRLSGDAIPLHSDWLFHLLAPLMTDLTVGLTWGSQQLPEGLQNPLEHLCQLLYGYNDPAAPPRRVTRTATVLGCNMATRRDLWARSPLPELPQAEDYAYFHRLVKQNIAGVFVPGATVLHGHEESLPRALSRSLKQSALQVAILLGREPRVKPVFRGHIV